MKLLVGIILSSLSMSLFAANYSGTGEVTAMSSIYLNGGKPEFELYGTWPNKDGCTDARLIVGRDAADTIDTVNSMYSMLMSAYIASKQVELYIDCVGSVPVVKYVYLPDSPAS